jgi:transposase-like protein
MARPKKYPDELIARAVRIALEGERPIAHIAHDLGIHPETLRKRVRPGGSGALTARIHATRRSRVSTILTRTRCSLSVQGPRGKRAIRVGVVVGSRQRPLGAG